MSYAKYKDLGNGEDSSNNITSKGPPPQQMPQQQMQMPQQMSQMPPPSEVMEIQSLDNKKHFIKGDK